MYVRQYVWHEGQSEMQFWGHRSGQVPVHPGRFFSVSVHVNLLLPPCPSAVTASMPRRAAPSTHAAVAGHRAIAASLSIKQVWVWVLLVSVDVAAGGGWCHL